MISLRDLREAGLAKDHGTHSQDCPMEEKTLDDFRQPNAIEQLAFGPSMLSRGACVEAENSFAATALNSIEWPNANLPKALA